MPNYSEVYSVGSKRITVNHHFVPEQAYALFRECNRPAVMADLAKAMSDIGNVDFVVSSKKIAHDNYECDVVMDVSRNLFYRSAAHVATWADRIERFLGGDPDGNMQALQAPIASGSRVRRGMTAAQVQRLNGSRSAASPPAAPAPPTANISLNAPPPTPAPGHTSYLGNFARYIGEIFGEIADFFVRLFMYPFRA